MDVTVASWIEMFSEMHKTSTEKFLARMNDFLYEKAVQEDVIMSMAELILQEK